ncbi:hypothetical protein DL98DRAFT_587023 [Cadophora sp. DSE1049]|nr:hypothetical protein DL98DRAFT_587023 [Cadophora sp. DSE1049]
MTKMTACRLFFLPLALLWAVDAHRNHEKDSYSGTRWLERDRSLLVRLDTPDLPDWDTQLQTEDIGTSLIFNFTLQDKRILLLNDVPIFPLEKAYVPRRLYARQSTITQTEFQHGKPPSLDDAPLYALDYHQAVPATDIVSSQVASHPAAHYNVLQTQLEFDILGAGIAGQTTLLRDDTQRLIIIKLQELGPYAKKWHTNPTSLPQLKIFNILLRDRYPYHLPFSSPEDLEKCTLWSWRCSEIDEYPWYKFVYREAFDQYGEIGSLRHLWLQMCERFGFWQVTMIIAAGSAMLLSPLLYGLYRAVVVIQQRVNRLCNKRKEHEQQILDEEAEGLLQFEDSEDFKEKEDAFEPGPEVGDLVNGWHSSRSQADIGKPLPPIPGTASSMP